MEGATDRQVLVDAATISKITSMPIQTIWRGCRDGVLPHYRLARTIRFDPQEILKLLRKESTRPPPFELTDDGEVSEQAIRRRLRSKMNKAGG